MQKSTGNDNVDLISELYQFYFTKAIVIDLLIIYDFKWIHQQIIFKHEWGVKVWSESLTEIIKWIRNQTCPRSSVKFAMPMLCVIIINCTQEEDNRNVPTCTKGIGSSRRSICCPCCYVISLQLEPILCLHQSIKYRSLKQVFFWQEMLQEAWHYRQTNFTAYRPSDSSIEFNIELMPWTGKFLCIWVGPSLLGSCRLGSSCNASSPNNGCLNPNRIPFLLFWPQPFWHLSAKKW